MGGAFVGIKVKLILKLTKELRGKWVDISGALYNLMTARNVLK
jgi:hypothetical protein